MPSSLIAPVASRATEPLSWIASTAATSLASASSSKGSPFRAACPRRTIDITPAICLPPITAILALGQMKVKRLLKARPDIA